MSEGKAPKPTAVLLRELHVRGFRQFPSEWTQAADWALEGFVDDGGLALDWTLPSLFGNPILAKCARDLPCYSIQLIPKGGISA